jgi:predicted GNAT family N-acyltransferase
MDNWQIEPLDKSHQRGEFCCGKAPLDDFLKLQVSQYRKRRLGQTYVLVQTGQKKVCGYYTLASSSVPFQALPDDVAKKLPKHPVPVILLGRLAVDSSFRGQRLGEHLLMDALAKSAKISQQIGVCAVEVDALDEEAKAFYLKYSFLPLLDRELHLFLPMKTIEQEFLSDIEGVED